MPRPKPQGNELTIDDQGATGIVEMLFCTSLVALVGSAENQASNSPRKLQIVNTKVSSSKDVSGVMEGI